MNFEASIIAVGNELLNGDIQDKNAYYLSRELRGLGWRLKKVVFCPDIKEEIVAELDRCASLSSLVLICGGLGPTSDDITRYAIAESVKEPLEMNELARAKLELLASRRQRPLDETNYRQVYFPRGAAVIPNDVGTADAFSFKHNNTQIVALPGVPSEVIWLWEQKLRTLFMGWSKPEQTEHVAYFRLCGIAESKVAAIVESLHLPSQIGVAYRPQFPEILLSLGQCSSGADVPAELTTAIESVEQMLASYIFSRQQTETLSEALMQLFVEQKRTVAVAESCSGGLLCDLMVRPSGASAYFLGGVVTYANSCKEAILEVPKDILQQYGAVSEQVALAMAVGVRRLFGADYAVSVTGVAGPEGGSEEKPVGTFWVGCAAEDWQFSKHFFRPAERTTSRRYSAAMALYTLYSALRTH